MPYAVAHSIVDITKRTLGGENRPVFLFVNFLDPHSPYNPPRSALRQLGLQPQTGFSRYLLDPQIQNRWPSLSAEQRQALSDLYDGELRGLDQQLERLLDWIDEKLGNNTIVVVTSDHGEELGEEGRVGHDYGLSQAIIHVPLFLRVPEVRADLVSDIVETRRLYELILTAGQGERVSLRTLVPPTEQGVFSERYPSAQHTRSRGAGYDQPWVSLIDADYKGIGPSGTGFRLLDVSKPNFDLEPAIENPRIADEIRSQIDTYWDTTQDKRTVQHAESMSNEEVEALRALGYIQ